MAIENGPSEDVFPIEKWGFSIAMLVYQTGKREVSHPLYAANNHGQYTANNQGQLVTAQIGLDLDCFFSRNHSPCRNTGNTTRHYAEGRISLDGGGDFIHPGFHSRFMEQDPNLPIFFPMKSENCTLRILC